MRKCGVGDPVKEDILLYEISVVQAHVNVLSRTIGHENESRTD